MATGTKRSWSKAPSRGVGFVWSHPVRCRILVKLSARSASPKELARELKLELGDVSYQCRELRDQGLIEEVETRPVRGSTEHFYRAIQRPAVSNEEYREFDPEARRRFNQVVLQLFGADAGAALDAGTMTGRHDHRMTRIPGEVDEEGWKALGDLYIEMEERIFDLLGESANRIAAGESAERIPIVNMLTFFELPEPSPNAFGDDGDAG